MSRKPDADNYHFGPAASNLIRRSTQRVVRVDVKVLAHNGTLTTLAVSCELMALIAIDLIKTLSLGVKLICRHQILQAYKFQFQLSLQYQSMRTVDKSAYEMLSRFSVSSLKRSLQTFANAECNDIDELHNNN